MNVFDIIWKRKFWSVRRNKGRISGWSLKRSALHTYMHLLSVLTVFGCIIIFIPHSIYTHTHIPDLP